ncbi:MAG: aminotransferase class V-fold PLP-dependent enzyme [Bacteroidota bacterium]
MENPLLNAAFDTQNFLEQAHLLLKATEQHLSNTLSARNKKVVDWQTLEDMISFWEDFLKNGKTEDFFERIYERTTHTHHPKYMGHQVAAPAPVTALSSALSSVLNNGMAVYEMGMAPSAIERIVIDNICQHIGYEKDSGGFLTSGGSLANLTALLAARKAIVPEDIWNEGYSRSLGIMVCEEAHYCVDRAAKIMGLGEKGIIKIPTQPNFSMDVALLEEHFNKAKANGITIFAIIGSAPSTATGAYDDLEAIGHFARKKGIWFHADGAHGGAAIYANKYKSLVQGIQHADSVVVDGHKMLLMPTITTALLFKSKTHAQNTFSQQADYLLEENQEDIWYQSGKMTFECTKTMMCLHWFILLKMYGEALFDEYVTRQYDLTRSFARILNEDPDFELATHPQSNILCFRWIASEKSNKELNRLNAAIRQQLLEDGEFYIVQTQLRGIHYLRTSLMNPFTTLDHLAQLTTKIKAVAEQIN